MTQTALPLWEWASAPDGVERIRCLRSSNIRTLEYRASGRELVIEFATSVYVYEGVPLEVWLALKAEPESMGAAVARLIVRGGFEYKAKLRGGRP